MKKQWDFIKSKFAGMSNRTRYLVAIGLAGGATGALADGSSDGSNAVAGLGLDTMIHTVSDGIKATISNNSSTLMIAVLPIMAFFFIWNRLRSIF